MIEVIKKEYWSKSEAFLLPLTGLNKSFKFGVSTYLFWGKYSIENYHLLVKFTYKDYDDFLKYCIKSVFPVLGSSLVEAHDYEGETVFVIDISEWALDIEMFLRGKYSRMSKDAKDTIVEYHTYYDKIAKIPIEIIAAIEPNEKYKILDNQTPIEYVAENYGINIEDLRKLGEIGSIYNKEKETLTLDYDTIAG
jgi:hypothetical protein